MGTTTRSSGTRITRARGSEAVTIVAPVRTVEIIEVRPLEQWRQDLLAAADWLEANEWCQGVAVRSDGARCAAGALSGVTDGASSNAYWTALAHLAGFITGCAYETAIPFDVPHYNNEPGRTKDEVISTMRACAMQP